MLHVWRVTHCIDVGDLVPEAVGALFKQLIGFVYDEPLNTVLEVNITISRSSQDTQSNLLDMYLEGQAKSVFLNRGTCYQYWLA